MKTITKTLGQTLLAALLGAAALTLTAQDAGRPERPEGGRGGRMGSPVVAALDVNQDGTIDATEIANAAAALLKLDANGDGQLTGEELRPQRPAGHEGGPGGRGPGGEGKGPRGPKPAQ
jgi:hypothetical protein